MCDMRTQDKDEYRRLLDEIGEEYCDKGKYCLFKEFLVSAHPSRRLLVQLKCCDQMKWIKSKNAGKDVGWAKTLELWISEGYATLFAEAYKDDRSPKEIFKLIIEKAGNVQENKP